MKFSDLFTFLWFDNTDCLRLQALSCKCYWPKWKTKLRINFQKIGLLKLMNVKVKHGFVNVNGLKMKNIFAFFFLPHTVRCEYCLGLLIRLNWLKRRDPCSLRKFYQVNNKLLSRSLGEVGCMFTSQASSHGFDSHAFFLFRYSFPWVWLTLALFWGHGSVEPR